MDCAGEDYNGGGGKEGEDVDQVHVFLGVGYEEVMLQ